MIERSVLRLLRGSDAVEAAPLLLAARDKSALAPALEAATYPICLHLYGDSNVASTDDEMRPHFQRRLP